MPTLPDPVKKKVAYLITCEEATEIIYATNSAAARRMGANEIGIDFQDVESCRRAPYLDQYVAGGGPAPKMLIEEHSWRFECGNCFDSVDQLVEERVYDQHEYPYCCAKCLAANQKKTADSKAAKEVLLAAVALRWPGATVCWINESRGTAFLRIDTAKAGANWDQKTDELHCQPADAPAWRAYKESLPAA